MHPNFLIIKENAFFNFSKKLTSLIFPKFNIWKKWYLIWMFWLTTHISNNRGYKNQLLFNLIIHIDHIPDEEVLCRANMKCLQDISRGATEDWRALNGLCLIENWKEWHDTTYWGRTYFWITVDRKDSIYYQTREGLGTK